MRHIPPTWPHTCGFFLHLPNVTFTSLTQNTLYAILLESHESFKMIDVSTDEFFPNSKMMNIDLILPEGISFSDLGLRYGDEGDIYINFEPVKAICEASGLDAGLFKHPRMRMNLANLILAWYQAQLATGGPVDPVSAHIFEGGVVDDWGHRHQFVFPPGHA